MDPQLELKIEAYIGGEMSPEEARGFEAEMQRNPELMSELKLSLQTNHFLKGGFVKDDLPDNKYVSELRDVINLEGDQIISQIKQAHASYQSEIETPKKSKFYLIAAASIALLICTVGFMFFNQNSTDKLYAEYFSETDLPSITKRGGDISILESGLAAFNKGEFPNAIKLFDTFQASEKEFSVASYIYEGMAEVELGNTNKAIASFDTVINSNTLDASKGLWFKSLAYIKAGDKLKAKLVLQEVVKDESNFNYAKAKTLLEKL